MKIAVEYIWQNEESFLFNLTKTLFVDFKDRDDTTVNIRNELLNINVYSNLFINDLELKPVSVRLDPFRKSTNVLVLCNIISKEPTSRMLLENKITDMKTDEPIFACKFMFFLCSDKHTERPGQSKINSVPFSVNDSINRAVPEQAYHLGLESGLSLSGFSSTKLKQQWCITIGQYTNIQIADDIVFLKYILQRLSQTHDMTLQYCYPKNESASNPSVCEFNYNIGKMRSDTIDCTELSNNIVDGIDADRVSVGLKKNEDNTLFIYDKCGLSYENPYSTLLKFLNR